MSPYYADDLVTLYHADCREVGEWSAADVLVTDPPYGIAYESNRNNDKRNIKVGASVNGDADTSLRDYALETWGGLVQLWCSAGGMFPVPLTCGLGSSGTKVIRPEWAT